MQFSKFFAVVLFLSELFFTSALQSSEPVRLLVIEGDRIFTPVELKRILKLEEKLLLKHSGEQISETITGFYKKNGYSLVKVHIIEDSKDKLVLYINEGRLGKIIVHGLNNYYSLKVKQLIDFPGRIYNTEVTEQNIDRINHKYHFKSIKVELQKIADYSDSLFQIDRELKRITMLQDNLKLFSDFPPEYDLHFYPEKGGDGSTNGLGYSRDGVSFNINYKYPSVIIPEVSYYRDNILYGKDYLELDVSSGFDPGLKGFVSIPPSNTFQLPPERSFSQLTGEYKFNPYMSDFFGPILRGKLYQSTSSRSDLGLSSYDYIKTDGVLAPEFTFLKYFNIYAGFGYEKDFFYKINIDETADRYLKIDNRRENYPYFQSRIKLDPIPIRLGNRIDKYLILTYSEYTGEQRSREFEATSAYDFEFSDLSIYSLKFKSNLNFLDTPFHHNAGVSSSAFKGFSGRSYYTNKELSVSNEYRIPVYQDYIYAGAFIDAVVFEPEGYLMSGTKSGVAAGPTGRFLFYDQFELIIYYSIDYLFPDGVSGTNLQASFRKKW